MKDRVKNRKRCGRKQKKRIFYPQAEEITGLLVKMCKMLSIDKRVKFSILNHQDLMFNSL